MYRLLGNNLNVLVNIQYGIGFELIKGNVEIETTIFNITKKSKVVPAHKNKIIFKEKFIWNIDRNKLKNDRTTNQGIKIECFTTPDIRYGNILYRKRIGYTIIKLKEIQIIVRDWDQDLTIKHYKLQGSSKYYQLGIVIIIQEQHDLDFDRTNNKTLPFEVNKQDSIKTKNISTNYNETDIYQNNNILDKQNHSFEESLNLCDEVLYQCNTEYVTNKRPWTRGIQNELKNEVKQYITESKESLRINKNNDSQLVELLENSLKSIEDWLKVVTKIKKYVIRRKKNSSNLSILSENDTERPFAIIRGIKKKLNELAEYMNTINEDIKNNKFKCSQDILKLKSKLSEQFESVAKKITEDV